MDFDFDFDFDFDGTSKKALAIRVRMREKHPMTILPCLVALLWTQPAPDPGPGLPRRPYVQHVTPEGLSLLWQTQRPETCDVRLRSLTTRDTWERTSGPAQHHEVRFEGLVPSARYEYTVSTAAGTFRATVRTAPATGSAEPFTFLVYGDTRNGHGVHRALAQVMAFDDADFVIHTGDFVSDGQRHDKWNLFLEYSWPLMRRMPLYPTLGNHENAFGDGLDLYRRNFEVPDDGPFPEMVYAFTWGNSRFFVLDTNQAFSGAPQTSWLRTQLAEAALDPRIRHLFVSLHQSAYTSGPHGPQQDLLDSGLVDDLRHHGVLMTFSAHDHFYERGRVDGLHYVITAGGGAPIYAIKTHQPHSLVTETVHHYCRLRVEGDLVELTAVRLDGSLLDSLVLRRAPGPSEGSGPRHVVVREHRATGRETPAAFVAPPGPPPPTLPWQDDAPRSGVDAPRSRNPLFGAALVLGGAAVALLFLALRRRRRS